MSLSLKVQRLGFCRKKNGLPHFHRVKNQGQSESGPFARRRRIGKQIPECFGSGCRDLKQKGFGSGWWCLNTGSSSCSIRPVWHPQAGRQSERERDRERERFSYKAPDLFSPCWNFTTSSSVITPLLSSFKLLRPHSFQTYSLYLGFDEHAARYVTDILWVRGETNAEIIDLGSSLEMNNSKTL